MSSSAAFRTATCCRRAAIVLSRRSHNNTRHESGGEVKELFLKKTRQINPMVAAAALVLGSALSARFVYGQLLGSNNSGSSTNNRHGLRRDKSRVVVKISTAAYDEAKASSADRPLTPQRLADGSKHASVTIDNESVKLQSVDAASFAAFVSRQQRALQSAREQSQSHSAKVLRDELATNVLSDVEGRMGSFADWYFGYSTQYGLLGIAMASAAKHAVTFRSEQSLSEAVTEDIQAHVSRKYEALVLRPAITDPKVHRAFVKSLKVAHADYMEAVGSLDQSIASFIETEATAYAVAPRLDQVDVDIDWTTPLQKVQHIPLAFERHPEMSVAIVGASAAAGKAAGGAAAVAAVKALSAKLAAPFATKAAASTLAKAATAGAAGGAALAGPAGSMAGAAAGAAIGLGVDVTVNAGVALVSKPAFEKDVQESLRAMCLEWEERLLQELERCQNIWFGHAEELLRQSTTSSVESAIIDPSTEGDGSED